jgi:hypothetical protein
MGVDDGAYSHFTIVGELNKRHIKVEPGQSISFVYSDQGPVLTQQYHYNPDAAKYKKFIIRALTVLFGTFGFSRRDIKDVFTGEKQLEFDYSGLNQEGIEQGSLIYFSS